MSTHRRFLITPFILVAGILQFILVSPNMAADLFKDPALMAVPPQGAVILFDGKDLSAWKHRDTGEAAKWKIVDGAMEVTPGTPDLITIQDFGDYQLHVEFNIPVLPGNLKSQERGNSGVYNHGRYEIQVLDSFNNETYANGMCGSIYEQKEPDINACKPAGQWQSYDITFRGPRLGVDHKVVEKPRITVYHNGILIHDNVEILADFTRAGMSGPVPKEGPILLQNHGSKVRYRNIWIVPFSRK
ncbi:MAG TPA: DUF1080 domain-containing protein [Terriglobia bacterium]|nr:DUF1080 domain-containing protein [Terriglobia bacterium]